MHEYMITKWNGVVGKDDIVFYLGDLTFESGEAKTGTKEFLNRLNGKIHFVLGNHDNEKVIRELGRFETISDYIHLSVLDSDVKNKWQVIILSHFPLLSWDKGHRGSIHLHGHEHHSMVRNENYDWYYKMKVMDVGVNGMDYTPISYTQVKEIMGEKENGIHH